VLNLHLDPGLATLLAQRQAQALQAPVIEGHSEPAHSLAEGAGGAEAPEAGGQGGS
jgi:hypothetical protein